VKPRASWKGVLKIGELRCPVGLHAAASTAERLVLHTVNRATGNRVQRRFIDSESGEPVEADDQVKGFEDPSGGYVVLEPDEIRAALPESDKTLSTVAFLRRQDIDDVYFDRPYYLLPDGPAAGEAYGLVRDGLAGLKVAALARAFLFRRVRTLLVYATDDGLAVMTLNFDHEIRPAAEAFDSLRAIEIKGEMLDLAAHIIATKRGTFDPAAFDDRYEAALTDLVKAKLEGRPIKPAAPREPEKTVDLLDALRRSVEGRAARPTTKPAKARKGARRAAPSKPADPKADAAPLVRRRKES
jgi:DNA end-binding protein Ku